MNPTAAAPSTASEVRPQPDGSVVVAMATDPARPPVPLEATVRHPDRFRAALAAFLGAVIADVPVLGRQGRPTTEPAMNSSLRAEYSRARRTCARRLIEHNADLWRIRLPVDPIVTVAEDAWIAEGFAADQSAYARVSVSVDEFDLDQSVPSGTASVAIPPKFLSSLNQVRGNVPTRLEMARSIAAPSGRAESGPPGWLRGFAAIQSAMSLPSRRVPIDRGGLFGLIETLGQSRRVRAGRSVVIRWEPGRSAEVVVRPGARPVPLHARAAGDEGIQGSVRVAVGHRLGGLAGLLPWVDSADLFLPGPGLPSFWSVQMGGIRVFLGLPGWTLDGRLGSLRLDSAAPPIEPGRFLANQVAATFRNHPAQTRRQVVDRTRGSEPEVAAVLTRLAGFGQVLPEPETGLFRWRPAFDGLDPDDPEPAEATAARAITQTRSVQVTRDEVQPDGHRRVEGLILDRPVAMILDADGWISRGRCTCSHLDGGRLDQRGPCRHLLALQAQAQAQAGSTKNPEDLATWFAGFPAPINPV